MHFSGSYNPQTEDLYYGQESAQWKGAYRQQNNDGESVNVFFEDQDGEVFEAVCPNAGCELSAELASGWKFRMTREVNELGLPTLDREFTDPDGL